MKKQITVTFRNGEAIQTYTYEAELGAALCDEIRLSSDRRLESVAWNDVLSVVITPVS